MKTNIRSIIRLFTALTSALLLLPASPVLAQMPGDVDPSFDPGSSINGDVRALARQSDGKWIVAGSFTTVHGMVCGRVARLNADGSTDHTFMNGLSGANLVVNSVALQSDGKILVGGTFTSVHGISRSRIARLNTDGTLDTGFGDGLAGADNEVRAIAVQSDGTILIGGVFTTVKWNLPKSDRAPERGRDIGQQFWRWSGGSQQRGQRHDIASGRENSHRRFFYNGE